MNINGQRNSYPWFIIFSAAGSGLEGELDGLVDGKEASLRPSLSSRDNGLAVEIRQCLCSWEKGIRMGKEFWRGKLSPGDHGSTLDIVVHSMDLNLAFVLRKRRVNELVAKDFVAMTKE
jgi:hypothetical protein